MFKNNRTITFLMSHKEVLYGWFILITLSFVGILLLSEPLSTPTGFAVSLLVNPEISAEKTWDFSNSSDYTYNSSAISVNGTVQLVLITATTSTTINEINESSLLFATEYEEDEDDTENRTTKVNTLGNGHVKLDEGEVILEVIMDSLLQNDDILSLYILSGTDANAKIHLCRNSSGCSAGLYGNSTLPSTVAEGWYNITISGIPVANDTFFFDSPDKIKIDMVKGYVKSTRTEITTTSSYPSSASIQTANFQPVDWKSWGVLSKTEQLNEQTINYSYSTNSGSTWTAVPVNLNVSAVTQSVIQFKVELNSNMTATPVIDTLTMVYNTQQACTESWGAQYGSCLKNDTKLKYYTDSNECGTTSSLPTDNNTYISCDYCTPQWNEINSSCRKDNLIKATFRDHNNCYATTGLSSDNNAPAATNYSCNYCILNNCSQSGIQEPVAEIRDSQTIYVFDAVNTAHTKLEIDAGISPATVEIIEYSYNIKNETPSSMAVNRYIDLQSNETTISSVTIILYYNDSEIAALDENTLQIYYYNETSQVWDALSSIVNSSGNYVSATVPHMSLYGLFGEQPSSGSSSSVSSGGGSRKIATVTPAPNNFAVATTQTVLPTKSEPEFTSELNAPISETSCEYVLEMSLPDEIVVGESESYEGEIVNKGDCEIPELKLGLSPELESKIGFLVIEFSDISPGDKKKFTLIRKKSDHNDLFSATSYVIGSLKTDQNTLGQVILQGYDETGEIFRRELPVSIVLKNSFPWKELVTGSLIFMVLLIFAVRFWYGGGKKNRNGKSKV